MPLVWRNYHFSKCQISYLDALLVKKERGVSSVSNVQHYEGLRIAMEDKVLECI